MALLCFDCHTMCSDYCMRQGASNILAASALRPGTVLEVVGNIQMVAAGMEDRLKPRESRTASAAAENTEARC